MRGERNFRVLALVLVGMGLAQVSSSATAPQKLVSPGEQWQVAKTIQLSALTIGANAHLSAPPGYALTLTIDGVEHSIEPGDYRGHIVVTVSQAIDLKMAQGAPGTVYRAAVMIEDGHYVQAESVAASVNAGQVTDTEADDLVIRSVGERFNGVIVAGNSRYRLNHPTIDLSGNGGNDMAGFGAAVLATGHADLTLDHARITTHGAVRSALFVSGHAIVHVENSEIVSTNGTLPPDYKGPFEGGNGAMMEVPWMLGISGNVRATNVIENGTVYYNNSLFRSQGWGVLSADAPTHVRMVVSNSHIENTESGYGAYTIGDTLDTFSHCTFNVVDVGLVVTGYGSALVTDGTVINSRRFGVMMHTNDGKFGTLTIDKGSEINSRSTAFEIKGRGVRLILDGAHVSAGNGLLLEAIPNDDPFVGGYGPEAKVDAMLEGAPGSETIHGMGMPPAPGSTGAGPPPGSPPGLGLVRGVDSGGRMSGPVLVTLKDVDLHGDIVNARTQQGGMRIDLQHAALRGAVTTAIADPATHNSPSKTQYFMIGEVRNVFQPTHEKYGLDVILDGQSHWLVDQTSYLTHLELAPGASITAPIGYSLSFIVDGSERTLAPARYDGHLTLRVTPVGF